MSHADTLRTWAGQCITPAAREPFLAGADALDTLTRVHGPLPEQKDEPQLGEAWLIDFDGERAVAILGKVEPADEKPMWFTDDGGGYYYDAGSPITRLVPEPTKEAETIQTLSRLLTGAEQAATERAEQIDRVRAVLAGLRGQQEAALQRWDDTGDPLDGATSDTLHDTIHLLTEALEGETLNDHEH